MAEHEKSLAARLKELESDETERRNQRIAINQELERLTKATQHRTVEEVEVATKLMQVDTDTEMMAVEALKMDLEAMRKRRHVIKEAVDKQALHLEAHLASVAATSVSVASLHLHYADFSVDRRCRR